MPGIRSAILGVLVPALVGAQQNLRLTKPDATFPEPFTQIASVRELRDGRVLLIDRRERIVLLVDFRSGKSAAVGRNGSGPGEYAQPQRLFTLGGDTTAIYDGPARRFVIVQPDGKPGDDFRMDAATGAGQRRGGVPKWSDGQGRVFTEGSPFGENGGADSAAIARFARGAAKGDTIAFAILDKESVQVKATEGGGVSIANGIRAFAWRDDWVGLPDGGVAVVRVKDYHVDWYSASGARMSGPAVTTTSVPVTAADRQQAIDDRLAAMRGAMTRGRPGSPPGSVPNDIQLPELTFPSTKPPFEVGSTVARPDGEVWVMRSRAAVDKVAVYDVFTKTAGHIARVTLPPNSRVVGFGAAAVYTVRIDDADLQYLEQWRIAPFARP